MFWEALVLNHYDKTHRGTLLNRKDDYPNETKVLHTFFLEYYLFFHSHFLYFFSHTPWLVGS